jgi:hypothetical protein
MNILFEKNHGESNSASVTDIEKKSTIEWRTVDKLESVDGPWKKI